jgi:hypothetical protein
MVRLFCKRINAVMLLKSFRFFHEVVRRVEDFNEKIRNLRKPLLRS